VPAPGVLHISPRRPARFYIKDAVLWINQAAGKEIVLKGSGWAVGPTVEVAEEIKRAIKGLHQITTYGKKAVMDEFEPMEFGLDKITKEKMLPTLEIRLSIRPLDSKDPGYQAPIDPSLVKEMTLAEAEAIA